MYLLVKMPKIQGKNTFRGKQTTNHVSSNIFRCFEDGKKWYGWCSEVQIIASKIDGTFSAVKNKEQGYPGVFTVWNATRHLRLLQLRVKTPQNSRNNIFIRRKTTNKVPSNMFRALEVGTKVRLVFTRPKNKNKVCLVYLQCNKIGAANAIKS